MELLFFCFALDIYFLYLVYFVNKCVYYGTMKKYNLLYKGKTVVYKAVIAMVYVFFIILLTKDLDMRNGASC